MESLKHPLNRIEQNEISLATPKIRIVFRIVGVLVVPQMDKAEFRMRVGVIIEYFSFELGEKRTFSPIFSTLQSLSL